MSKAQPIRSSIGRRGFSLVELMIAVAILGLVAVMTVPEVVRRMPRMRLDKATTQLYSDLRLARMQAISFNTRVQVRMFPTSRTYTIWTDRNRDGVVDEGELVTHSLADVPDLTLSGLSSTGTFMPRGTFDPGGFYYWYASVHVRGAGSRYIYIFPSGEVDFQTP